MNILIVTQYFYPERFRINDIAKSLQDEGHNVVVYTGLPNYPSGDIFKGYHFWSGPYRESYHGIDVIRVPLFPRGKKKGWRLVLNYLSFMVFGVLFLPRILFRRFDRIFVFQLSPVTSAFPAIVYSILKKTPVYFWVTDLWPETLKATNIVSSEWALQLWGKFVTYLYKQSKVVMVSSRGFIQSIVDRGIPPEKIVYWPYWGEDLFTHNGQLQKHSEEIPKGFIVMFAGNIGSSQSFDTILDAAEMLKPHKQIKWVIIGDGHEAQWVRSEIENRSLHNQVYLLGPKPLEAMPGYYEEADVLLASLKKDPLFSLSLPSKIQSYLPSGKPILVSIDGEAADLIQNEAKAGLAAEASNAQELAQKVLDFYQMPKEQRDLMGKNGRQYFDKNFDRKVLLNQLMEIMN